LTVFLILSTISIYFIALKVQSISDKLKLNLKEINDKAKDLAKGNFNINFDNDTKIALKIRH